MVVEPAAHLPLEFDKPEETPTAEEHTETKQPDQPAEPIAQQPENKQPQKNQLKKRDFQPHKSDGFDSFFGNSKGYL